MRPALLVVPLVLSSVARSSSVSPLTLWELVERSELIVVADVEAVEPVSRGDGAEDWNSHRARLRVVERWKGEAGQELNVAFPGNLSCPAPPAFPRGRRILAFLGREQSSLVSAGLAAATRSLETPGEVSAYRTVVSQAIALQDPWPSRPSSVAQRRAWQLRLVTHPATRLDGLPLLRSAESSWSDEEKQVLARAFVDNPPPDETLRWTLRALRGWPDPAVTTAGVSALDAVLQSPRVPSWGEEALDLVRERLGADGPPKAPVDPLQPFIPRWESGAGIVQDQVRAAWLQLKERFRLEPRPVAASRRLAGTCEPLLEVAGSPGRKDSPEPITMLKLARSCAVAPDAVTSWFPRHQLKVVMESARAANADWVERVVGPRRCELGAVLWSFKEPVLVDWKEGEAYRVVWRPSLASPVVFRVAQRGRSATAVLKRDKVRGEALSGRFDSMVREVSEADFAAIRRAAEAAECWKPRHTCRAELSVEPGLVAPEGGSWLLEGARNGEHWSVDVDDPRPGPFLDVAMAVVRAGRGEPWLNPVRVEE